MSLEFCALSSALLMSLDHKNSLRDNCDDIIPYFKHRSWVRKLVLVLKRVLIVKSKVL